MYGLQYQRSYSAASWWWDRARKMRPRVWSARSPASGGTGRGGLRDPAQLRSGARIALSSRPPVETMPVIVSVRVRSPALTVTRAAGVKAQTLREPCADHAFLGAIREPAAIDMPPGIGSRNAGHEFAAVRNIDRVTVPGADQFSCERSPRAAGRDRHGNIQERRKPDDIVAPENRLQFAEIAAPANTRRHPRDGSPRRRFRAEACPLRA